MKEYTINEIQKLMEEGKLTARKLVEMYLKRINEESLNPDAIRAAQGSAGMKAIYDQIHAQVFE